MNNKFKSLDNTGTFFWLAMDACWMLDFDAGMIMAAVFSAVFTMLAIFVFTGTRQELLNNIISYGWFWTNFMWATHDWTADKWFMSAAKVILSINVLLIIAGWIIFQKVWLYRKMKS